LALGVPLGPAQLQHADGGGGVVAGRVVEVAKDGVLRLGGRLVVGHGEPHVLGLGLWDGSALLGYVQTQRDRACEDGGRGYGKWAYGNYFCYLSKDKAILRWTDKRTSTFGVIDAHNRDLGQLYASWEDLRP
jgi:hypothetical protein